VAALFALLGVGFAGGSLLLARALSPAEFGIAALWLAVYYVCGALAPWGAEGVVNRRRIRPGWRLARRTLLTSAMTAMLAVIGASFIYPFSSPYLLLLLAAIIAGGMGTVAAAQFQARHRFSTAMSIWRGSNLVLLFAAGSALLDPDAGPLLPIGVFTAGTVLVAGAGWLGLRRVAHGEGDVSGDPYAWREALSYFLAASAAAVLPQVERLVIPNLLSLRDLAVFGVLAALVIAPFRMFQAGIGYTLFPRLSKTESRRERRGLIRAELRVAVPFALFSGVVVWYLAPWVTRAFLGDKYELGSALLLAGLVAGFAKLVESFGRALVSALGTTRELAAYGTASWVALGAACLGAGVGARWGVPGVIYGTTAGLSLRSLLALVLGLRHVTGPQRRSATSATTKEAGEGGPS
jgi:O-antigen/teichoic acid export membrane protein